MLSALSNQVLNPGQGRLVNLELLRVLVNQEGRLIIAHNVEHGDALDHLRPLVHRRHV